MIITISNLFAKCSKKMIKILLANLWRKKKITKFEKKKIKKYFKAHKIFHVIEYENTDKKFNNRNQALLIAQNKRVCSVIRKCCDKYFRSIIHKIKNVCDM